MQRVLQKIWKEFIAIVAVTIALVFFSVKRSTYADNLQQIENVEQVYATLSQQIAPLAVAEHAGDDLMNEKISSWRADLQTSKEQLPDSNFTRNISHLQANLATLQEDLSSARALLPIEKSRTSYYNHGSIDLLDAYDHRQQEKNKEALPFVQSALANYNKAQQLPLGDISDEQITTSTTQAQQLYYLIALSFIIETQQNLQKLSKETVTIYGSLIETISSIKDTLIQRELGSDVWTNACKQDLLDVMTTRLKALVNLPIAFEKLQTHTDSAIHACISEPFGCISNISAWYDTVAKGRNELHSTLEDWLLSYQRLGDIVDSRDLGALRKLCGDTQQGDSSDDTLERMIVWLEDAVDTADKLRTQQDWNEKKTDESDPNTRQQGLPVERDSNSLEEIHQRGEEWLQKTSDLQRDPTYTPQKFLNNLFDEFWWDKTGF